MSESPLFHRLTYIRDTLSHTCKGNMLVYAIKYAYMDATVFLKTFIIVTISTHKIEGNFERVLKVTT